jgi:hypothetical protein
MAFQITDPAQLTEFNRLWDEVNLVMSKGGKNPTIGLFQNCMNSLRTSPPN